MLDLDLQRPQLPVASLFRNGLHLISSILKTNIARHICRRIKVAIKKIATDGS